jgi:hypothetical protein
MVIFTRKIDAKLPAWRISKGRRPLILRGATSW